MITSSDITAVPAPRIAVIGPGALGTLFAARLTQAGLPTLLLDYRRERAAALSAHPLTVHDAHGVWQTAVPVSADPYMLQDMHVALVLVKAYQSEEVAATLATYLPATAIAVSLQNGLGNVESLMLHLGTERAFGGTTAQGAFLRAPGVVEDTGHGPTVLGHLAGRQHPFLDALAQAMTQARFSVTRTDDLPAALWMKTILNAAINPVAALTGLRNGQLSEHESSLTLMTAAAREAAHIARKHGIHLGVMDWRARLQTICRATATNINSMLQDIRHTRRTEIDAINGAIVRIAESHKLPCTINRTLLLLLLTLQTRAE